MVLEAIFDFGIWLFGLIAEEMPVVAPVMYNVSTTLSDLLGIGVWVIGEGMWTAIVASISAWLAFKLIWGAIIFVYKLIPLIG